MKTSIILALLFVITINGQTSAESKTNVIGMELVKIPAGSFMMGSPDDELWRDADEGPLRKVVLSSFWMGKFEVTQAEYEKITGEKPSAFRDCDKCPVENVSWEDAKSFLEKLSAKDPDYSYRLPSESEWEYAARAGAKTPTYFGEAISATDANFDKRYPYNGGSKGEYLVKPENVGSYKPNAFGLYDMHGNVYEWVEDVFVKAGYSGMPTDGSANLEGDPNKRIQRGGGWSTNGRYLRAANRAWKNPRDRNKNAGFRVVAEPK